VTLVSLSIAMWVTASCGDADESRISACDDELKDLCGTTCTTDVECASQLHCDVASGTCTAQCVVGDDRCPSGQVCTARGQCIRGINLDGGGGSSGDGGNGCPSLRVELKKETPTVVLLIDQSGSMRDAFSGGNRWDVLHTALMDPTNGVVARLENEVRFGLALYTSHNGNQGGECPVLTEVAVSLGNYAAIKAVYDAADPDDETPTGESISAVAAQLAPFPEPGQKVIVLATDGEPDTCEEPNPSNGQQESIAAAQAAFQQGIFTFVISVGDDVSLGHLQDVANAGRGLPIGGSQNAAYYLANDQSQLTNAFNTIINGVRTCIFPLTGTVNRDRAGEATITLDGAPLGYEDPNGWQLIDDDTVELLGDACDAVMNADADNPPNVTGNFPCGVIDVPE
jgi:hypothetical protein